jgi:hypothetical protein
MVVPLEVQRDRRQEVSYQPTDVVLDVEGMSQNRAALVLIVRM